MFVSRKDANEAQRRKEGVFLCDFAPHWRLCVKQSTRKL